MEMRTITLVEFLHLGANTDSALSCLLENREGILQGALLVVDSSLTPVDGSLLVCAIEGEYRVKRYRKYPRQHLEDLSTGKKEALPVDDDGYTGSNAVFGVITHIINDARGGEFDDSPAI